MARPVVYHHVFGFFESGVEMKGHRGVVSGHLTAVQVEGELMFSTSTWNRFDPEGSEDFTAWRKSILKGVEQGEGPVSAGDLLRVGTVDLSVTRSGH